MSIPQPQPMPGGPPPEQDILQPQPNRLVQPRDYPLVAMTWLLPDGWDIPDLLALWRLSLEATNKRPHVLRMAAPTRQRYLDMLGGLPRWRHPTFTADEDRRADVLLNGVAIRTAANCLKNQVVFAYVPDKVND